MDPENGYEIVDGFFVGDGTWSFGMRGMEIDCDGHLWLVSEPGDAPFLLEIASGEDVSCATGRAAMRSGPAGAR